MFSMRGLAPGLCLGRGRLALLHVGEELGVLAVTRLDQLLGWDEAERGRVHAEALAGRRRAILEHVAEMCVAVLRAHFDARHAVRLVSDRGDVAGLEWLGEARPACTGIELVGRGEERLSARDIDVDARRVVVPIFVAEGRLGAAVLGDFELLRCELFLQLVGARLFVLTVGHGLLLLHCLHGAGDGLGVCARGLRSGGAAAKAAREDE
jgi:hypothetical protein